MTQESQFDFSRDGCLLVREALDPRDLDPLIHHIDGEIGRFAENLKQKGEVDDILAELPFDKRLVALSRESEHRLRRWNNIALCMGLYDVICHPGIIEILTPILDHDFGFNGDYHLRSKLPNSGYTAFPWHQDSQYYGQESQFAKIITMWIPLVDVDQENGCLQVLPAAGNGVCCTAKEGQIRTCELRKMWEKGALRCLCRCEKEIFFCFQI